MARLPPEASGSGARRAPRADDPYGILGGLELAPAGELWATLWPAGGAGPWGLALGAAPGRLPWGGAPGRLPWGGAPGESGPDAAEGAPTSARGETCAQCGGQMRRGANDLEYVCGGCGLVVEGDTAEPEDDEAPRAPPSAGRLRMVGPNSNQLQPDLYRSGSGNTAKQQKEQILEEYKAYNAYHVEAGGRDFPKNAFSLAAEYYNAVQRKYVKRSQSKKTIMASCLHRAGLTVGFAPTKAEIAKFMQLPNGGIAGGDNFVRGLIADGDMDIEANIDPCRPEIETLFAHLGFDSAKHGRLREAVFEVVQVAIRSNIGTSSILRSKVAGATYAVLRRCKDRALVPRPLGLPEFCGNRIRKNTVERFLQQLDAYHSFFADTYLAFGLDATAPR